MADFALSFGSYTFPNPDSLSWNFADLLPDTSRMIGLSGGFDAYGTDPAPAEIGRVSIGFNLIVAAPADMQAAIDAVGALASLGVQTLTYQPEGTLAQRWCKARVNSIPRSLRAENGLVSQPITAVFQVADPHWYEAEDTEVVAASGLLTTQTIAQTGNAITVCNVTIACSGAQTVHDPIIRRKVSGVVVDEIAYTGTIAASKSLIIDRRKYSVTYDGATAYTTTDFVDADWLRLAAGNNSIEIVFGQAGDAATVTFSWYPAII